MDIVLRLVFLFSTLTLIFIIFRTISRKTISVRYALMWLLFSAFLLFFIIYPLFVEKMSRLLNFESSENLIFVLVLSSLILMLLSLTTIVSKQSTQIQSLIQEVAILKHRVDDMDEDVN